MVEYNILSKHPHLLLLTIIIRPSPVAGGYNLSFAIDMEMESNLHSMLPSTTQMVPCSIHSMDRFSRTAYYGVYYKIYSYFFHYMNMMCVHYLYSSISCIICLSAQDLHSWPATAIRWVWRDSLWAAYGITCDEQCFAPVAILYWWWVPGRITWGVMDPESCSGSNSSPCPPWHGRIYSISFLLHRIFYNIKNLFCDMLFFYNIRLYIM